MCRCFRDTCFEDDLLALQSAHELSLQASRRLESQRDQARREWALLAASQYVDGEDGSNLFRWRNEQHLAIAVKLAEEQWPGEYDDYSLLFEEQS